MPQRIIIAALLFAVTCHAQVACPYANLAPLASLTDKRLVILGTDHETDVYDAALEKLRATKPDAISLELFVSTSNIGESYDPKKRAARAARLFSGEARFEIERHGSDVVIRDGDHVILDTRGSTATERNAGLVYAIERGIPFYFTDWSNDMPNAMFGFVGGKIVPISLEGKMTGKKPGFPDVPGRNRFTADGLRLIYHTHSSIAHIGGYYHFWGYYDWQKPDHLQNMLPTGKQEVHFLVKPN